jgi:hypothetical protein
MKRLAIALFLATTAVLLAAPEDDKTSHGQHEGGSRGWGFHRVTNADAALPRVLLVGDSIANGYHGRVADLMKGKANLDLYITGNHIAGAGYRDDLAKALKNGPYAVIHYNESGLHAWVKGRVPEGQYGPLFAEALKTISAGSSEAKVIWAANTPATVDKKPGILDPELAPIIDAMNKDAGTVAKKEGLVINDLNALMADKLNLAVGDRWHWSAKGQAVQADAVAAVILRVLPASSR